MTSRSSLRLASRELSQIGELLKQQTQTEVTLMSHVAVITGASRRIGAASALVLAERGFRVVVNYRASAEADEVVGAVTATGGEAVAVRADVTVADDVSAMVDETNEKCYAGPFFIPDRRVDPTLGQQAIDAVAGELGVAPTSAADFYGPTPVSAG